MKRWALTDLVLVVLWIGFVALLWGCSGGLHVVSTDAFTPTAIATVAPTKASEDFSPRGIIAYIGTDGNLWLMDANGDDKRRLTDSGEVTGKDWSPDGRVLAFAEKSGENLFQIHLYDVVEASDKKVLSGKTAEILWNPKWSPDGRSLAYLSWTENSDVMKVFLYSAEDGSTRTLEAVPQSYPLRGDSLPPARMEWAPDGRKLLLDIGCCEVREVYVLDASTGKQLYRGSAVGYALSRNGVCLAMGVPRQVNPPIPAGNDKSSDMVVLDLDHDRTYTIAKGSSKAMYVPVAWISDNRLLYKEQPEPPEKPALYWVVELRKDGVGKPKPAEDVSPRYSRQAMLKLLPPEMRSPDTGCFTWSPDGRWVAFHVGSAPGRIYVFGSEGNHPPVSVAKGHCPAWQP